ncbi:Oidioi.mRNA.OKI2018_I69.chr2.g8254.t1.cds [Oikopleura dioica]|uniref:Oidioi.mRNA.OKI2018_I69.chr2.g8254.t1.cds n=1 Tax=Oikopleura dioica TaxID=34765 RepID=A0ABN7TDB8_OIKDI|nr:Oidioi.mRNA.OKI2018_I69.chr2.g8254.t1.cds [Oikopleura dioica]
MPPQRRHGHLRQQYENSMYSQSSNRSSIYAPFMPDGPAYHHHHQEAQIPKPQIPKRNVGGFSDQRSETSSAYNDFIGLTPTEEKKCDSEISSKLSSLIESRFDDQRDETKELITKAASEIKEDAKGNASDLSSKLDDMNKRVTKLEEKSITRKDLTALFESGKAALMVDLKQEIDKKAKELSADYTISRNTASQGVQCSMSQESICSTPEVPKKKRRKRCDSTPPASPMRQSQGITKRRSGSKKFLSEKPAKLGLQMADVNKKRKTRRFSDRLGAEEDEFFLSLRPTTPEMPKREKRPRRIDILREEDSPVYPRTCPPRPRTQKKPAPCLPVPIFRDETLEVIPENYGDSSEDDTYRRSQITPGTILQRRRRKIRTSKSIFDFSKGESSSDETTISVDSSHENYRTSEYGTQDGSF